MLKKKGLSPPRGTGNPQVLWALGGIGRDAGNRDDNSCCNGSGNAVNSSCLEECSPRGAKQLHLLESSASAVLERGPECSSLHFVVSCSLSAVSAGVWCLFMVSYTQVSRAGAQHILSLWLFSFKPFISSHRWKSFVSS